MNYVILDLEWDSVYLAKQRRFFNQIIQIGAVKLNSALEVIDTFEVTVKSAISKRLSKRFVELTGITKEEMQKGIPFENAVDSFNRWSGDNNITLTWSTSDLYAIYENVKCLLDNRIQFNIAKYVDLQSFVQNELRQRGTDLTGQISLSHAAEMLGIPFNELELHTAKDDCLLSARIFAATYKRETFLTYIRDASCKEFYKRLTYKAHHLTNIHDKNIKNEDLEFCCDVCGKPSKRVSAWKYKNRWFLATFYCKACKKRFVGRVSFKKTYDDVKIKKRVTEYKKAGQSSETVQ